MRPVAYNEELADVDEKKMFGGVTLMVGGQMCCGVLKTTWSSALSQASSMRLLSSPASDRSTSAGDRCRTSFMWISTL